ncbi:MAG: PrgI family protein [Candidatus Kaiserbacteria bacterium]|nr:PrgI family protein [Candidatus Kaiserbacteria bacterium]
MQFQVPQFIEVEDKIFGPFTFKQFVFLAGGAGTAYLLWRALPLLVAAPLIAIIAGMTVALAFVQYNGRPFLLAAETAFYYLLHSKLYLWNNVPKKVAPKKAAEQPTAQVYIPHLSDSRLHDLAWSLDIKERIAAGVSSEEDREARSVVAIRTPEEIIAHMQGRHA